MNLKHRLTPSETRRSVDPRRPRLLAVVALSFVAMLSALSPSASAATTPSVPTNLTVTAASSSSITLQWGRSYADNGIQGYRMFLDGAYVGWSDQLQGATQLSYTFNGLSCGKSYTLGVTGVNLAEVHGDTATLIGATAPCGDTQAPSAPGGIAQIAKTASSATISWNPSSDNVGVVGYGAYQGGIRIAQTPQTTYTFANLSCGQSLTIGVDAYDAAGNRSGQTSFVVTTSPCSDTQPPTAPTNLTKTGATETTVTFAWTASTDNAGVAGYGAYNGSTRVGQTTGTTYTFTGLACGQSYSLAIDAYDAAGNRSDPRYATIVASTSACPAPPPPSGGNDNKKPSVPTNLKISGSTQSSVTLSWSASTDNVGVVGYGAYNGSTRVAQTAGTTYTFTGLSCGKSYSLGIDAYDAAGNRSDVRFATVIASTGACSDAQAPTAPTNLTMSSRTATSISLTWSPSTDNVGFVGYGGYKAGASVGTSSSTSYTVTGLSCGATYTIGVDAYDASGNRSSQSAVMMATTACNDTVAPTAPTALTTANVTQTALTLSWTASTDNVGVAGYDVFANGTKIGASTTATSNALAGLTCGAAYTLGVEAFDAAGNRSTRSTKAATMAACSTPVGANLYVSPSGNDANSCTATAPCASFNRAYQVAQPGQTVQVAGGTYPMQVIADKPSMRGLNGCDPYGEWGAATTAKCVRFVPAPGATVTQTGPLEVHGSSLWFNGTRSGAIDVGQSGYNWIVRGYADVETDDASAPPDHVVFNGIYSKTILSADSDKTMFRQMSVGGQIASASGGNCIWIDMDTGQPVTSIESKFLARRGIVPTNVVLDQNYFHDTDRDAAGAAASCHFGGMI